LETGRDQASKTSGGLQRAEKCEAQRQFRDWELLASGILLEPLLRALRFFATTEEMIEAVRRDLARGLKKSRTGRNGLTRQTGCCAPCSSKGSRIGISRDCETGSLTATPPCVSHGFNCQPVPTHGAFKTAFTD